MNDFESSLEQQFSLAASDEPKASLRTAILSEVDRELRARRRDRLAMRVVFVSLLLGIVGNYAINRHEVARMARWFPNSLHSPLMLTRDETVLVEAEESQPPNKSAFADYLVAFYYPPSSQASAVSARAQETAAWIDEFAQTGKGI